MSVALIATLLGAAASGISSGIGASQAANERKKAENLQSKRERESRRLYDKEYNQNYLDTDTARVMLNRSAEKMRELGKQNQNSAIKTGATQENKIASAEAANKSQSDLLANLVEQGQKYRENLRNRYESKQDAFDQQNYNRIEANAQSKSAAWGNVSNAIGNVAQGFAAAYTPKTTTSQTNTGSSGFGTDKSIVKQDSFGDQSNKFSNALSRIGSKIKVGNEILGIH